MQLTATHGPIGLFGKMPAHGDFVRSGIADALVQRFTRWLEEGSEACHRAGTRLPAAPVRFLYRSSGDPRALAGALRGSVDKVGREFPLAVFVPVDGSFVPGAFPAVPAAYGRLLDAASALLGESESAAAAALSERARALPLPGAAELRAAQDEAAAAAERVRTGALLRLLGDVPDAGHYALLALDQGARAVREREPSAASAAVDGPADGPDAVWGWLELARLALRWRSAPAFFWRAGAAGRVLVALGPAPAWALPSLAEPRKDGTRVWPLVPPDAQAAAGARKSLGPARAAAVDRPESRLGELAQAVFA